MRKFVRGLTALPLFCVSISGGSVALDGLAAAESGVTIPLQPFAARLRGAEQQTAPQELRRPPPESEPKPAPQKPKKRTVTQFADMDSASRAG